MRDKELERLKASTFIGSNNAFLGCLLCALTFQWDSKVKTAAVSETTFKWNPKFFDSLTKEEKKFVLLHELWHIALLHSARIGTREPKKWNDACDYKINAQLKRDGYTMPSHSLYADEFIDPDLSEEEIYNHLPNSIQPQNWGTYLTPASKQSSLKTASLVQQAMTTAKMAGDVPNEVVTVLTQFLKPKLPWKTLLHKYLLEQLEPEYQWNRPNRRFRDIYLPSLLPQEGGLTSIALFLDTSGSISEEEIKRFTSEAKYIQRNFNPEKLRIIQFDTQIQEEIVYTPQNPFKKINLKGGGGTSYSPVREYILKHKPTLSIIFTDLCAMPMEPVGKNKVLWVISYSREDGPFGESIHVD